MKMQNVHEYYTTSDLNLAAVLVSQNFFLEEIKRPSDTVKAHFCFHKNDQLLAVVDRYWKNQLLVSPQVLFTSLKTVKSRLYGEYDGVWRNR